MDIGDKKSSYIALEILFNTLLNMNKYKIILAAHCAHQAFEAHVIWKPCERVWANDRGSVWFTLL